MELGVSGYTGYESGYGAGHVYTALNPIGTMEQGRRAFLGQMEEGKCGRMTMEKDVQRV